jgi:puromycin-sensitive aminopeptidase
MTKIVRLLEKFTPRHYDIYLDIDDESMSFSGTVSIYGKSVEENESIKLHSVDIDIDSITVNEISAKFEVNSKDKILTISSASFANTSKEVVIKIDFHSKISETIEGLYTSEFKEDEKDKLIFSTQLETHHARELFPCIDEPEAKATFQLSVTGNKNFKTFLGNTPIIDEEISGDKKTVRFDTTPIMSTYLLALVMGDMEFLEAKTQSGIDVRTYATKEHVESTKFALETAVRVIEFFTDYFGIKYPLPKCDFVAIPEFAAGAMENWGLITFRESAMLVDPENSSLDNKQWVALVVAHEIAHQWFGNLVTMKWWDDLWLNEGFASWAEYLAIAELFPDWDMWTQFISEDYLVALKLDSLANSHPIEMSINDPRDTNEIFDSITYRKGCSVIRQLHDYMGREEFRKGINNYLNKYLYRNATTSNLWQALEESSGLPISEFMSSWTQQSGYPVVSVQTDSDTVITKQQRFILSPIERTNQEHNEIWPIPLTFSTKDKPGLVMSDRESSFPAVSLDSKLNIGQAGFFRASYDDQTLVSLSKKILSMQTVDVMGFINDSFELAKAGYIKTGQALNTLLHVSDIEHSSVWDIAAYQLLAAINVMDSKEIREASKTFGRDLIAKQYNRLGWEEKKSDSHSDKLLRPTILSLACRFDYKEARQIAKNIFLELAKNQQPIPANIRGLVYGNIARDGNKEEFDTLLKMHNDSTLSEERSRLCSAITSFKQPELVEEALSMIKTDVVKTQDVVSWLFGVYRNRHGKNMAWQWEKENWEWIEKIFGDGHMYTYFLQTFGVFAEEDKALDIENFFKDKDIKGISRTINQSLEQIRWQAAWKNRDKENVLAWFKNYPS